MNVTPEQLIRVTPSLAPHAAGLLASAVRYEINTPLRLAHWLAQMAHESGGFETMVESLNYGAKALKIGFGRHRISLEDADRFGRREGQKANQNAIANLLYGGEFGRKNLGNTEPGDGWKFRGRGYKQLTGRDNYTRYSRRIFGDERLVEHPEQAAEPATAALLAGEFWKQHNLNHYADADNVTAITRAINGGEKGLAERKAWLARFKEALRV